MAPQFMARYEADKGGTLSAIADPVASDTPGRNVTRISLVT